MGRWIGRLIGILEIGGGFVGIVGLLRVEPWKTTTPFLLWMVWLIAVFVFLLGIAAGLALLERSDVGIALSAVYQALQIVILSSSVVTYSLVSGLQLAIGWWDGQVAMLFSLGGHLVLFFTSGGSGRGIAVNLLALPMFLYLLHQMRRTWSKNEVNP